MATESRSAWDVSDVPVRVKSPAEHFGAWIPELPEVLPDEQETHANDPHKAITATERITRSLLRPRAEEPDAYLSAPT
jgi:hypothetical protein